MKWKMENKKISAEMKYILDDKRMPLLYSDDTQNLQMNIIKYDY